MTELLEQAIAGLQTLPESGQNAIASISLDEINDACIRLKCLYPQIED